MKDNKKAIASGDDSKKKKNTADMNLVQKILYGEKAILQEYDLVKKKEDRNKLLRFHQVDNSNN